MKRVLSGHAVASVARERGIGESMLHHWMPRHRLTDATGEVQAEQAAEMAHLKRALAQKEEEAAILKKARAYLTGESQ